MNPTSKIIVGDCLKVLRTLPDCSVQTCITSPPYWGLRDYGHEGQLGLERTPEEYVANMVAVFREVRRVLRDDGTLWLNLGDSYTGSANAGDEDSRTCESALNARDRNLPTKKSAGLKPKDLVGIPWRVAFALQADGWWLRQDIIWHKPNPMPESVTDRCTKSHEYIFLMTKNARYYYDAEAVAEPLARPDEADRRTPAVFGGRDKFEGAKKHSRLHSGNEYTGTENGTRNKRSVWTVASQAFTGAHFATFPPALIEPCVLAGSREGDTVLDPFNGAGTTGLVALGRSRHYIGIEINPEYAEMARARIDGVAPLFRSTEMMAA